LTDRPRLIEVAFPLKQTSLDSVHEKNVRHGHISTLHIWSTRECEMLQDSSRLVGGQSDHRGNSEAMQG
jgi:hypothetical protein